MHAPINRRNLILCLTSILCLSACISQSKFIDTLDYKKDWETIQANLPAYPQPADLLEFDAGPTAQLRYFIDQQSISIDEQRVIRYTIVAQSAQGADNVAYEGIRCETRERKRYAFGNNETHTWVRAKNSQWQLLEMVTQSLAQRELAKFYFCPRGLVVGSPKEAIHALKAGIHPTANR
ncbi:hypothetical protein Nstercoris_00927 [Nitrosomonas stercoris]|uniref:CNP1-like uncharacterized domain-containing protein n=1 Tax=Nitrosomonas stercoris TaxID=1444684 RepID=A0A4Y1YRH0_9PROT|nr:hypothetical protein Nstercoris_00927 [Nitrosomonas stercoris]